MLMMQMKPKKKAQFGNPYRQSTTRPLVNPLQINHDSPFTKATTPPVRPQAGPPKTIPLTRNQLESRGQHQNQQKNQHETDYASLRGLNVPSRPNSNEKSQLSPRGPNPSSPRLLNSSQPFPLNSGASEPEIRPASPRSTPTPVVSPPSRDQALSPRHLNQHYRNSPQNPNRFNKRNLTETPNTTSNSNQSSNSTPNTNNLQRPVLKHSVSNPSSLGLKHNLAVTRSHTISTPMDSKLPRTHGNLYENVKNDLPENWDKSRVQEWLKEIEFDEFSKNLKYTDGKSLIALEKNDLIEMGIPIQAAIPLATQIENLKRSYQMNRF